jgi:hypothetical protein
MDGMVQRNNDMLIKTGPASGLTVNYPFQTNDLLETRRPLR